MSIKSLAAGLTFVNVATILALLFGMIFDGLSRRIAFTAFLLALVPAVLAYLGTSESETSVDLRSPSLAARIWFWFLAACFAFFAFRSFCWLLFLDGGQLKVQSINNLGDLSLHIAYIKNFASGVPLWPDNPIYFASKMRYPAGTDLFNALLLLLGLDLTRGLIWGGLFGMLAIFVATYRWGGSFTVAGLLFNGGLAGFAFFRTGHFLDYQGDKLVAWKSLALSMLVTQRGLLYALPAGLLLLCQWRSRYLKETRPPLPFWVELSLYATMPLFHLHTFMALSVVAAFLLVFGGPTLRRDFIVLIGSAFIPATFLVWTITDHFQAKSLLQFHPGWVQTVGDFAMPFFAFWIYNFGLFVPIALVLAGFCLWRTSKQGNWLKPDATLVFVAAAFTIFLFAVLVKTAPWEWDNIKLIIWAYLIFLPFLWSELIGRWELYARAAVCFALFTSGFISLFGGLLSRENGYTIAERAEVDAVGAAVKRLSPNERFAAFPTYNHPLLLQGRKVVLGYPGHLWTQGFDYTKANTELEALMRGAPNWHGLARQLQARYLFWGREEKAHYIGSTRPWERVSRPVASGTWGVIYDLEATLM